VVPAWALSEGAPATEDIPRRTRERAEGFLVVLESVSLQRKCLNQSLFRGSAGIRLSSEEILAVEKANRSDIEAKNEATERYRSTNDILFPVGAKPLA
jgi:hypothetical protein